MMPPSSLPACDVKNAGTELPAQLIPRSTTDAFRAGNFQKFMGQAQAGQKAPESANVSRRARPSPLDQADQTDRSHQSDASTPSAPPVSTPVVMNPSVAGLLLAMLAQNVPPAATEPASLQKGDAPLTAPPSTFGSEANLTPLPSSGQGTARPATDDGRTSQNNDASLTAPPAKAGRAVLCPPSALGSEANLTPLSPGGQGTARPATDDGRASQNNDASLTALPATAGRAVLCPPSALGSEANLTPLSSGGQETARPATDGGRTSQNVPPATLNPQSAIRGSTELAEVNPQSDASSQNSPSTPPPAPPGAEIAAAGDIPPPLAPLVPPSGTPAAINGQRMKSASQRNEIAGSAAQKLPPDHPAAPATAVADEAIPRAKNRLPNDFSDPKPSAAQWMGLDTTAKGVAAPTLTANVMGGSAPSSGRLEQVERMISREVVMVRQSGAETLAVSLKVDSRTSLFLQLTNHHGQIEASVRCETGDATALDAHWGQLQESLARQNVQLLPLEDKSISSNPSFDAPSSAPGNFQDGQPAQHQPPRPPAPEAVKPSDDAINAAIGLTKSKNKPRHLHGWEKWA